MEIIAECYQVDMPFRYFVRGGMMESFINTFIELREEIDFSKSNVYLYRLLSTRSLLLSFPYSYILMMVWCRHGGSYKKWTNWTNWTHFFSGAHVLYTYTRYINIYI